MHLASVWSHPAATIAAASYLDGAVLEYITYVVAATRDALRIARAWREGGE